MRLAFRRLRGAPPLAAAVLRGLVVGLRHKVGQQHHLRAAASPAQPQNLLESCRHDRRPLPDSQPLHNAKGMLSAGCCSA